MTLNSTPSNSFMATRILRWATKHQGLLVHTFYIRCHFPAFEKPNREKTQNRTNVKPHGVADDFDGDNSWLVVVEIIQVSNRPIHKRVFRYHGQKSPIGCSQPATVGLVKPILDILDFSLNSTLEVRLDQPANLKLVIRKNKAT